MRLHARRWDDGESITVQIKKDRIVAIEAPEKSQPNSTLPWISPGFVDLQINGFAGFEFTDIGLDVDRVTQIAQSQDAFGVVRFCPTVTTNSNEILTHALKTLASAAESISEVKDRFAGIHLEGPFISPEDGPRGAHPADHVRAPNWDEFQQLQEAASGKIVLSTLSPEYDSSVEFIRLAVQSGVRIAIGHTAATADQIKAAVDAGASMSTHLGNGSHRSLPRHPNYLWDQLAEDRLVASLIVDGFHLEAAVVKTMVRAKTVDRCVLVSDVVGMAGMPAGRYDDCPLGSVEVLENGKIVIAGQRELLAGASLPIHVGVGNVIRFADIELAEAISMASTRPAELVNLPDFGFHEGATADLILFDFNEAGLLNIQATINRGQLVSGGIIATE